MQPTPSTTRPTGLTLLPDPGGPLTNAALARAEALDAVAEDLAGEVALMPLLERILERCTQLVGCEAGSICSVDEGAGVYRKEVDIGIRCQVGRVFPLAEGMTGAVVKRRGAVWFDRYDDVPGGHISPEDRSTLTSVIGVPFEWRGRIIGVCVAFSREVGRRFTQADAEVMQVFARRAAMALANATIHEAAEERARAQAAASERDRVLAEVQDLLAQGSATIFAQLDDAQAQLALADQAAPHGLEDARTSTRETVAAIRATLLGLASSPLEGRSLEGVLRSELQWAERACSWDATLTVSGPPVALEHRLAHEVLRVAQEAITNIVQHARAHTVRVGLVYDSAALTLLVQDDGRGFVTPSEADGNGLGLRRMRERTHGMGGSLTIDSLEGWGTSVKARLPYVSPAQPDGDRVRVLVVDSAAGHLRRRRTAAHLVRASAVRHRRVGHGRGGVRVRRTPRPAGRRLRGGYDGRHRRVRPAAPRAPPRGGRARVRRGRAGRVGRPAASGRGSRLRRLVRERVRARAGRPRRLPRSGREHRRDGRRPTCGEGRGPRADET